MSTLLYPSEMSLIMKLFEEKRATLRMLLGNLQKEEVQSDEAFERTLNRLKDATLLKEVIFSDFIVGNHRMISKQFPANYNYPMPHTKDVYIFSVQKPFTGSQELFRYAPDGYSFSLNDTGVYQPIGYTIHLEIETEEYSKEIVLNKAESELQTTTRFISQNNSQASNWSNSIIAGLKDRLSERRIELLNF